VTYQRRGDDGDTAELTGVLTAVNGCLVVRADGTTTLVYFPEDQVEQATGETIWLFGRRYRLGDTVTFGGGYYRIEGANIPEECQQAMLAGTVFTASSVYVP
jgi:hypothetical protein